MTAHPDPIRDQAAEPRHPPKIAEGQRAALTVRPPFAMLPPRPADGHKGTFGTVTIIGGCEEDREGRIMMGAPALAAAGALRAGAGLARLSVPASLAAAMLSIVPSATVVARLRWTAGTSGSTSTLSANARAEVAALGAAALVVGPGLGDGEDAADVVRWTLAARDHAPVVLDADGLNALAAIRPTVPLSAARAWVLTPHPGEFVRLAQAFGTPHTLSEQAGRVAAAKALAEKTGGVIVLKGSGTVVSDGARSWTCDRGHPCLATAGTGDVLAGLIGGLLAQHGPVSRVPSVSVFDLVRLAVEAHAVAGERWARDRASAGMLAMELADQLPEALEPFRLAAPVNPDAAG